MMPVRPPPLYEYGSTCLSAPTTKDHNVLPTGSLTTAWNKEFKAQTTESDQFRAARAQLKKGDY
ncbi:hypothetical protein GJ744_003737 [Endocarpon pusillum]|uniref:Uncharacterized protein n=1 Tax=Endocarpon pusillum TaxID=364733 RepID=A0A8H7A6B1_9EURO|nr:hypothetical protein GJ744_003737 [Endocarpon pusillum]